MTNSGPRVMEKTVNLSPKERMDLYDMLHPAIRSVVMLSPVDFIITDPDVFNSNPFVNAAKLKEILKRKIENSTQNVYGKNHPQIENYIEFRY